MHGRPFPFPVSSNQFVDQGDRAIVDIGNADFRVGDHKLNAADDCLARKCKGETWSVGKPNVKQFIPTQVTLDVALLHGDSRWTDNQLRVVERSTIPIIILLPKA